VFLLKALTCSLHIIEALGVLYLIGGIKAHMLIVGENVSQIYYHNWAVGVAVGTFIIIFLILIFFSLFDRKRLHKEVSLAFMVTLVLGVLGLILSTGSYGGSFLEPQDFAFAIPIGLALVGGLDFWTSKRENDLKDEQ
jgi:hypothetical protein